MLTASMRKAFLPSVLMGWVAPSVQARLPPIYFHSVSEYTRACSKTNLFLFCFVLYRSCDVYVYSASQERESASRLARSQAGQAMMQDVAQEVKKAKTFTPGKPAAAEEKLTDRHRAIYAERIAKATTVEEVRWVFRKAFFFFFTKKQKNTRFGCSCLIAGARLARCSYFRTACNTA